MMKIMTVCGVLLANLALFMTTLSANSACYFFAHQPKLPESARELRRF